MKTRIAWIAFQIFCNQLFFNFYKPDLQQSSFIFVSSLPPREIPPLPLGFVSWFFSARHTFGTAGGCLWRTATGENFRSDSKLSGTRWSHSTELPLGWNTKCSPVHKTDTLLRWVRNHRCTWKYKEMPKFCRTHVVRTNTDFLLIAHFHRSSEAQICRCI